MKNKTKHGLVTGLTALSTAIICQTSMTYASDIEIYKAPTTGGATLMFVLDLSGSMSQSEDKSVQRDFFGGTSTSCTSESKVVRTRFNNKNFDYNGTFCYISQTTYNGLSSTLRTKLDQEVIAKTCMKEVKTFRKWQSYGLFGGWWVYYEEMAYSCPDRVTMLVRSMFDLISGNSSVDGGKIATTNTPLPDTASIGFTKFYNATPSTETSPLTLTTENRETLLNYAKNWQALGGTPIARAYSRAAVDLVDHMSRVETACAGYGMYYLTDGDPSGDNSGTARTTVNPKLTEKVTTSQCDGTSNSQSWPCVEAIAQKLQEKKNTEGAEVKTAVVGFGTAFNFAHKTTGNNVVYNPETTYTDTMLSSYFKNNALAAAKAAVKGRGGWYSASNTSDIVNSVQNFVESIKVPIPAITTGTAAIPQDHLNPIAIQSYAYFPQFQPKPSEDFEAWFGNLKKFKVKDGVLVGQSNAKVFGADGELNTSTKDLWVNGASADLQVYGGLLSKLNLQTFTNGTDFARKVFTNAGGSIQKVNLEYMQEKIATGNNKYLLGALGYDLTETELDELAALDSLELTNLANRKQNRSIGAIMHSTPVLLTQSGKITYSDTKKSNETVDRDDYILFGTTQGALHVVKTGREADTYANDETPADYDGGKEIFTFIPEEMLTAQPKALLSEPNTTGNGMDHLYYGIDGAWTAHTEYVYNKSLDKFEVNPTSGKKGKQWVYGGMRMGGSSYYALDLTDIDQPKIKFRIDPESGKVYKTNDISGTAYGDLSKMGQSWSKPTIAYVQWKGQRKLVMLVGGGYDPQYEDFTAGKTTKGAGVYMFNADTGDLLWSTYDASGGDKSRLEYSVVSQIKAVDREGDGDVDHLYFGDLGGQVFRIDLKSNHSSSDAKADFAKITRLADFKETGKYAPRFYEMPAFSIYRNATGMLAVVSIGSGNRSTPLLGKVIDSKYVVDGETATENEKLLNDAIYNIYDLAVTDKNPATSTKGPLSITRTNLKKITDNDRELASEDDIASEGYNENSAYKGWYYEFTSSASVNNRKAVEKVQSDLVLLDSDLYVSTFDAEGVGSTESCGAGIYGSSRAHRFCMPYGQCGAGDTVEDNTMTLGKGLLGITLGQSTDTNGVPYRSIIGPVENRNPTSNKILNTLYRNKIKLTPYSWYERN
ncbi:pilus assembly protein [Acinetobacter variabilis]|uniref:pilus assembly protein n=1 Tax=Acinetobacter variabilis TaxID=70346 RepID=UPI002549C355|nr:PilC/PilY family type IV pilus protein [Acinetobacter variabilis]